MSDMDGCRLCGSEDGFKVNIFEPDSDYVKKIHKILPITINEHDPLPKTMCHRCSYKVNEFFEFRSKCIEAQEHFKNKLPWSRSKQIVNVSSQPPMVVLPLSAMNSLSPNEKQVITGQNLVTENELLVISDDDEPSFIKEETCVSNPVNGLGPQSKIVMKIKRADIRKRPRLRSIWDTKKKRRKPQMTCRITEVFSESNAHNFQDCEETNGIENDPLYISPVEKIENSIALSYPSENSQVEVKAKKVNNKEKRRTVYETEEKKTYESMDLSIFFLITKLPQGDCVYTCKECARTFVSSKAATSHVNESHGGGQNGRWDEEEEEEKESLTTYKCFECNQVFSRQSQLVTHRKKHLQAESSSDENFTPFNRQKRPGARRKPKKKPQKPQNKPVFAFLDEDDETEIRRHSLLSSDSE